MKAKFGSASVVYKEEFEYIFSNKAKSVRGATVTAAFVEAQILELARAFLKSRKITYKPESRNEFHQSLNILETNMILDKNTVKNILKFREERNKSIHGIFKGISRTEWNNQNDLVVELGRSLVKKLDYKLAEIE